MKVPKLIKLSGGDKPYKSLYTLMNGYGQVVGAWFLANDTQKELKPFLEGVASRFQALGMNGPLYAFSDICCGGDRKLYEDCFPTLKGLGVELQVRNAMAATAAKKQATFNNLGYSRQFKPVYITTFEHANAVATDILASEHVNIGFDTEYNAHPFKHPCPAQKNGWVDVVQLAVGDSVYVIHLAWMNRNKTAPGSHKMPSKLELLLQSRTKVFVGRNIQGDFTRIANHYHRNAQHYWASAGDKLPNHKMPNRIDLAALAKTVDTTPDRFSTKGAKSSLKYLCSELLGLGMQKGADSAQMSDWRTVPLQAPQLHYAGLDASIGLRIYEKLLTMDTAELEVNKPCMLLCRGLKTTLSTGLVLSIDGATAIATVRVSRTEITCPAAKLLISAPVAGGTPATSFRELIGSSAAPHFDISWETACIIPLPSSTANASAETVTGPRSSPRHGGAAPLASDDTVTAEEEAMFLSYEKMITKFWDADPDFPKQRVLLDAFHGMYRIMKTIDQSNSLRETYCSRLRDTIFAISDADIAGIKARLKGRGWSDAEIETLYKRKYSYFVRNVRRKIPKPQSLLIAFDELHRVFNEDTDNAAVGYCTATNTYVLGKKLTQDAITSLRGHIALGCLSDPDDYEMYYNIGTDAVPDLRCFRGTNSLEGLHFHLRRMFAGFSTSPEL